MPTSSERRTLFRIYNDREVHVANSSVKNIPRIKIDCGEKELINHPRLLMPMMPINNHQELRGRLIMGQL